MEGTIPQTGGDKHEGGKGEDRGKIMGRNLRGA